MECRLFLDVVVRQRAPILQLLAREDEALLVGGNALLVLNLRLDIVNRVGRLNLECDRLAVQQLDKDLHPTTQTEHKVECRLFLDVVVRQRAPVLQLLAREDEALLIGGNALLVLNLRLDIVNRVGRLDLERDGLAGQRFDEDLPPATQAEHDMKYRLFLDVVVRQRAPVLQLLAREGEALLIGGNALLVLNLRLDA
eukprot:3227124-Prymnesium_polylepis.1